jgi:outer membrane lipoprotein carrier protein
MKKILILFLVLVGFAQLANAQYDPKALEILDEMSAKYKKLGAFKAQFTHALENATENISEQFKGEIVVKGEKFRLIMSGQEIYNNGRTVWTYLPDINEVNIDNYYPEEGEMTPSKIYTAYQKGYKYLFVEEIKDGRQTLHVVDLVPENAQRNPIYKIRLKINKDSKQLNSWELFDKSGNHYIYSITDFDTDVQINDSYFNFDLSKHRGVEVIDLR